jgi:hypothetical protein
MDIPPPAEVTADDIFPEEEVKAEDSTVTTARDESSLQSTNPVDSASPKSSFLSQSSRLTISLDMLNKLKSAFHFIWSNYNRGIIMPVLLQNVGGTIKFLAALANGDDVVLEALLKEQIIQFVLESCLGLVKPVDYIPADVSRTVKSTPCLCEDDESRYDMRHSSRIIFALIVPMSGRGV